MSNPKDKAKELVDKFKNRSIELGETNSQLMAEANALIAVDEILENCKFENYNCGYLPTTTYHKIYWQKVKQEIENN